MQFLQLLLSSFLLGSNIVKVGYFVGALGNGSFLFQFFEFPLLLKDIDQKTGNNNKTNEMQPVVDRLFVCEQHLQEILNQHHHLFLLLY